MGLPLEELTRRGAREIIQLAIEAEVQPVLGQHDRVRLLDRRQGLVRDGTLPEHQILTAAGRVSLQVRKVRERRGAEGVTGISALAPS